MRVDIRHIVRDTRGASIIIALVFFLICGIIGSVVVTAASVEAKSVQTHRESQQAEFTVGSAAQTIGYDLDMAQLTVDPTSETEPIRCDSFSPFGCNFWGAYGKDIWDARQKSKVFAPNEKLTIEQGGTIVYGAISVDPDLNFTINLSLDENLSATSPYNMTVTIQCIPTYDGAGQLKSFTYERAVIAKTSGDAA